MADPVAAGGPEVGKIRDPREAGGRRRLVSWAWIVVVALANARSYRRPAALGRRAGVTLICDRWATDALVDLQLRYGKHAPARAILRHLPPRPDLQVVLELDASAAAARKPGDQAEWVLAEMERLYRVEAQAAGAERIDATQSPERVAQALSDLVEGLRLALLAAHDAGVEHRSARGHEVHLRPAGAQADAQRPVALVVGEGQPLVAGVDRVGRSLCPPDPEMS